MDKYTTYMFTYDNNTNMDEHIQYIDENEPALIHIETRIALPAKNQFSDNYIYCYRIACATIYFRKDIANNFVGIFDSYYFTLSSFDNISLEKYLQQYVDVEKFRIDYYSYCYLKRNDGLMLELPKIAPLILFENKSAFVGSNEFFHNFEITELYAIPNTTFVIKIIDKIPTKRALTTKNELCKNNNL